MRAPTRFISFMVASLLALPLVGCGDDDSGDDDEAATLSSIEVNPASVPDGLPIDVTQQFTATGNYSDGSVQDITTAVAWVSSDTTVASIGGDGLATAITIGTSDITASQSGIGSNAVALEVIEPTLEAIAIEPAVVPTPLDEGRTLQFTASGDFDNNKSYDITNMVNWFSTLPGTASIDETGLVTSVSGGNTEISANTTNVTVPAQTSNLVLLEVEAKSEVYAVLEPQSFDPLPINRTQQLTARVQFSDGSRGRMNSPTWTSSDPTVATVDDTGLVTGVGIGTASIEATSSTTSLSGIAVVRVNDAVIESVDIIPGDPAPLPQGFEQTFTARGVFSDGLERTLRGPVGPASWSVSDTSLAFVSGLSPNDALAQVEALASSGSVDVVFTDYLADGTQTGVNGSVSLELSSDELLSIAINPSTTQDVPAGHPVFFSAVGTFSGGVRRNITGDVVWVSSDTDVGVFHNVSYPGRLDTSTAAVLPASTNVLAKANNNSELEIASPQTTVNVTDASLVSIAIEPRDGILSVGQRRSYQAYGSFDDGSRVDYTSRVTWESSDDAIFIVVSSALVVGVSPGIATLTITDPESSLQDTLEITVSQP